MKSIPISVARRIAKDYDYHQVVIFARKTGEQGGEHLTTYGVNEEHCGIASRMAVALKKFMGWEAQ